MGDAGDGSRGVGTDAGQLAQFGSRSRQVALGVAGHKLRGFLQHASAAIVAQPAPQAQHHLLRSQSQRAEGGESLKKLLVALNDHGHTRLLQHDLRNPDGIGITAAPPGQVALVALIPLQQPGAQLDDLLRFTVHHGHWHRLRHSRGPVPADVTESPGLQVHSSCEDLSLEPRQEKRHSRTIVLG